LKGRRRVKKSLARAELRANLYTRLEGDFWQKSLQSVVN
jgi:hypothetical protein